MKTPNAETPEERLARITCDALWDECIRARAPRDAADAIYLKGRHDATLAFSKRFDETSDRVFQEHRLRLVVNKTSKPTS